GRVGPASAVHRRELENNGERDSEPTSGQRPITARPNTIYDHVLSRLAQKKLGKTLPSVLGTLLNKFILHASLFFRKMLSARGIRNACPAYNKVSSHLLLRRTVCSHRSLDRNRHPLSSPPR